MCVCLVFLKVDDEKPQITNCPADISVDTTKDRAIVDWREPSASDNSGTVNITLEDGPSPGSTLKEGKETVTYLAQDSYGNTAICTFIVEVSITGTFVTPNLTSLIHIFHSKNIQGSKLSTNQQKRAIVTLEKGSKH